MIVTLKQIAACQWHLAEGHSHKLTQTDHRWQMHITANKVFGIVFQTLGFALDHHHDGSTPGGDVQRLVGRIENENLAHASSLITRHAIGVTRAAL